MRHLPHVACHVQETLDQLLTIAAFDQHVTLLFLDDGVFQLKSRQQPAKMSFKLVAAMLQSLEVYGIEHLYVETESLSARGLNCDDLILPVQRIDRKAVHALLQQHDVVVPD